MWVLKTPLVYDGLEKYNNDKDHSSEVNEEKGGLDRKNDL